jgi:hypothetical protein
MPQNGAAVALPRELDPTAAAAVQQTSASERIGEAVADAAIVTYRGAWEHTDGGMSPVTQAKVGDLFVELYRLQERLGEVVFVAIARREGRRVLQERWGETLGQEYGQATLDAAIDEILEGPLLILARVTAVERALAH